MKSDYLDDCPEYLKSYLMNLKVVRDRADRTEEAYYIDIRTFLRYLKYRNGLVPSDIAFEDITIKDIPIDLIKKFTLLDAYEYLTYLKDDRNNSTRTRARKSSALKQFFNYLHTKAFLIENNPLEELELPRIKMGLPKYLTLEQSLELLKDISSKNVTRDYCMICLFLNCGMRLSELVGLDVNDYSKDNKTLRLFGKGRKERIVYLNNSCTEALDVWLEERKNKYEELSCDAIFVSGQRKRIDKRRVQQIVEENLKRAGLSNLGITTHKLRHTAATLMYQHGGTDTLVLKEILGHKSIATTEIYTHLSSENLKKAAESSPLANIHNDKKEKIK